MAAVAFAHKAVRSERLDYNDPEFELVAKEYKRTQGQVDRELPVTTPMLIKMRELLGEPDLQDKMTWGFIVLGFFFLSSSSEIWGPINVDR